MAARLCLVRPSHPATLRKIRLDQSLGGGGGSNSTTAQVPVAAVDATSSCVSGRPRPSCPCPSLEETQAKHCCCCCCCCRGRAHQQAGNYICYIQAKGYMWLHTGYIQLHMSDKPKVKYRLHTDYIQIKFRLHTDTYKNFM